MGKGSNIPMNEAQTSHVIAFAEIARGFCVWCENATAAASQENQAAEWLCRLQAAALGLPDDVDSGNTDGLPDLPADSLARATANLSEFNGCYYREFFDPDPTLCDGPVMGDVGDDLLDIYKDVCGGLILFERGETTEALWHWSFLHSIHWGRHAVGAIFALHCFSSSKKWE